MISCDTCNETMGPQEWPHSSHHEDCDAWRDGAPCDCDLTVHGSPRCCRVCRVLDAELAS